MRARAMAAGLLSMVVLFGGAISSSSAEPPPLPPGGSKAPAAVDSVTLITGDRVDVGRLPDGRRTVRFHAGPGREGIGYLDQETRDRRLTVMPADAVALVAAGRLDPRLFDVSGLIASGYADRAALPLIATYADGRASARSGAGFAKAGARDVRALPSVRGVAFLAPKQAGTRLWDELTKASTVRKVWLDGPVHRSLDQSVPQIGAPTAWQAGYTGEGVTVAVLDTGIDASHPDLADAVVEAKDFAESGSTQDRDGHGTHVASIVTGNGAASGGRHRGVAPDARLLVGKVLDDGGNGQESWIIAGMEWAANSGAKVVNLSLGGCGTDGTDPVSQALDRLTEQTGALFAVAAGNQVRSPFCPDGTLVSSPAAADRALAVGSVTKSDELSRFSNTGPRVGDGAVKPDLTAPGQSIVAARAEGTEPGDPVSDGYVQLSGTSMAAPHAAAAAAILAEQHPDWEAGRLKAALMGTAVPHADQTVFQEGAGRIDVAAATGATVLAEPASLSFGIARWPHDDDQPVTKPLTYRNVGTEPVTLRLTVDSSATGMFTLSADSVTVPAGGTAGVTVTADTRVAAPDGVHGATIRASAGTDVVVQTPAGITKEAESYDLTLRTTNRAGNPIPAAVNLTNIDANTIVTYFTPESGELTLRLPKSRYDLTAPIIDEDSGTLVARPDLVLGADTTVELDARDGRRADVEIVENARAEPVVRRFRVDTPMLHTGIGGEGPDAKLYVTPTPPVTAYPYEFRFEGSLADPLPAPSGTLPRGYNLYLRGQNRIPPDPVFRESEKNLAKRLTSIHNQGMAGEHEARFFNYAWPKDAWASSHPMGYHVPQPGKRIDFYTAGDGMRWERQLVQEHGSELDHSYPTDSPPMEPGTAAERWNAAPIGPVAAAWFDGERLYAGLRAFSSSEYPKVFDLTSVEGTTVHTTLRRNGDLIGTSDDIDGGSFETAPQEATWELTTHATRSVSWSALATRIDARWKVTTGPGTSLRLPLTNLWTSGPVNALGQAPAGKPFPLKLRAAKHDGVAADVTSLRLAVSYDDGETWTNVRPRGNGEEFTALLPAPPARARFASLRADLRLADGGELHQTVIRSYAIGS